MEIKVFVQSSLMCLLGDLGTQMLRGQQPLLDIICVCVCCVSYRPQPEVLRPVFVDLCVCVCVCVCVVEE